MDFTEEGYRLVGGLSDRAKKIALYLCCFGVRRIRTELWREADLIDRELVFRGLVEKKQYGPTPWYRVRERLFREVYRKGD